MVLGPAASRPRPPTGAQGHKAGPRLSAASASSRSMGSGPQPSLPSPGGGGKGRRQCGLPTRTAHSRLSLPGQRRRPETPPPPTSRTQPGNTLFMLNKPSCPPGSSIPAASPRGRRGSAGGQNYARAKEPVSPGCRLPLSRSGLHLRPPCASPRPQTRAIPTSKMAATAAPPTA